MRKFYILLVFCAMSTTMTAQLILTEAFYDPAADITGDANGDGTRDVADDEFMEFLNTSEGDLDIGLYRIYDEATFSALPETDSPRHVVPPGTIIPAGEMFIVFGGGDVSAIDGLPGVTCQVASSANLSMTNSGETMTVTDANGNVLISFESEAHFLYASYDQSVAITIPGGRYNHHTTINGALFSPGEFPGPFTNTFPLVLNEILADPETGVGDANGDGTPSVNDDEFLEFFNNTSEAVDISGYIFYDLTAFRSGTPRHVVPSGTIIAPGQAYVLFGDGTPSTDPGYFGNAIVQTSSAGSISIFNTGEGVIIKDPSGNIVFTFDTASVPLSFGQNQSITRSPDITGDFVLHTTVGSGLSYSPGKKIDGTVLSTKTFEQLGVSIYPNPVKDGVLHITANSLEDKTIELFDVSGRSVLKTKLNTDVLDVSTIKSGLYLLKMSTDNASVTSKLIIK